MNYLGAKPTRYLSDFNLLLFPTQRVRELKPLMIKTIINSGFT
jgi:hypothetical protein